MLQAARQCWPPNGVAVQKCVWLVGHWLCRLLMDNHPTAPRETEKRILGTLHVLQFARSPVRVDSNDRGKKAEESNVEKRTRASVRTFTRMPADDAGPAEPPPIRLPLGTARAAPDAHSV